MSIQSESRLDKVDAHDHHRSWWFYITLLIDQRDEACAKGCELYNFQCFILLSQPTRTAYSVSSVTMDSGCMMEGEAYACQGRLNFDRRNAVES